VVILGKSRWRRVNEMLLCDHPEDYHDYVAVMTFHRKVLFTERGFSSESTFIERRF
jgi:hypothetical protein